MQTRAAVNRAGSDARDVAESQPMRALARMGLAARGGVYVLIGALTVLMAFGKARHQADQQGAFQTLAAHSGGFAVLIVVFVGLVGYVVWRLASAILGPPGEDGGAGPRLSAAGSAVGYVILALGAFDVLTHRKSSGGGTQRLVSARLMAHTGGRWVVALAGLVVIGVGVALVVQGAKRKFAKRLELGRASPRARRIVLGLGSVGTVARGVVFVVIGILVVDAALIYRPARVSGMDGALRTLGTVPAGRVLLVLVGLGLLAFGLYGLAEARYRRT